MNSFALCEGASRLRIAQLNYFGWDNYDSRFLNQNNDIARIYIEIYSAQNIQIYGEKKTKWVKIINWNNMAGKISRYMADRLSNNFRQKNRNITKILPKYYPFFQNITHFSEYYKNITKILPIFQNITQNIESQIPTIVKQK